MSSSNPRLRYLIGAASKHGRSHAAIHSRTHVRAGSGAYVFARQRTVGLVLCARKLQDDSLTRPNPAIAPLHVGRTAREIDMSKTPLGAPLRK